MEINYKIAHSETKKLNTERNCIFCTEPTEQVSFLWLIFFGRVMHCVVCFYKVINKTIVPGLVDVCKSSETSVQSGCNMPSLQGFGYRPIHPDCGNQTVSELAVHPDLPSQMTIESCHTL